MIDFDFDNCSYYNDCSICPYGVKINGYYKCGQTIKQDEIVKSLEDKGE